jgi:D-ribose pyranose/furanose isomerase RbsD
MDTKLEKSKNLLTKELDDINNRVRAIATNTKVDKAHSDELEKIIKILRINLNNLNIEKAKFSQEMNLGNMSDKASILRDHSDKVIASMNTATDVLTEKNKNLQAEMESLSKEISKKHNILQSNNQQFNNFKSQLNGKMNLLATRDRMLQLSQERNTYKKKIIYLLFSAIITLLILMVAGYVYLNNRK